VKKEFNGETWMLIVLILLSMCSYWYLYKNNSQPDKAYINTSLELSMSVEEEKNNLSKSVDFIDQKIIKKSIEIIKEWLPVN
jgi:hypothetical protein